MRILPELFLNQTISASCLLEGFADSTRRLQTKILQFLATGGIKRRCMTRGAVRPRTIRYLL